MQVSQVTQVQSLGQEDPLEEEMETHSSILVWEIQWTEECGGLQSVVPQRVGHDWATSAHTHTHTHTHLAWIFLTWKSLFSHERKYWCKDSMPGMGTFCHVVVHSLNRVWLFATPWTAARQAYLSCIISRSLFMSIESVMPSNHLILCCLLFLLPSVWVGKIPWRRERLPTTVFWSGEFPGQSLRSQRVRHNWATFTFSL